MASERSWVSPFNFMQNNPINRVDPNGALDTWYTDKEGNVLMQTNDGSNDVVTVSDDKVADFEYYAESYENEGMKDVYESKGWNDHWKSEFGLADKQLSDSQIAHLEMLNSDWSRENAVEFWLNPTAENAFLASFSEAMSQWTNPELVVAGLSAGVAGYLATLRSVAGSVDDAANSARTWLGKDYRTITNKAGDNIFMSKDGLRKMRFDIKNSHGDKPHLHLEQKVNGKWKDAANIHRIYPKN
jgi:hypothetical protein